MRVAVRIGTLGDSGEYGLEIVRVGGEAVEQRCGRAGERHRRRTVRTAIAAPHRDDREPAAPREIARLADILACAVVEHAPLGWRLAVGDQRDRELGRSIAFPDHECFEPHRALADGDAQEGRILEEIAILRAGGSRKQQRRGEQYKLQIAHWRKS